MNTIPANKVLEKLDALLSRNDYSAAKEHLIYWLNEAKLLCDDKGILLLTNELMGLCRKLSQESEAIAFANSALLQIKKMGIQTNVGAATTFLNSATVYKAFGRPDSSLELFEKAKLIYEEKLSPSDERLAGLYNNMALTLVDLKQFDKADSLYLKAISVLDRHPDKQPEQAITYLNMASAAEAQLGLEDGAEKIEELLSCAMRLLDIGKQRRDGNYAFVCEKCATVFGYYGYFDYENQLNERRRRIYEGN